MSFLKHHGIEGQKWGVKHGPPYPIDRSKPVTIKSGSKVNSVSTYKKIKLNNRGIYAYDPNDEWDTTVYKGPFSSYLLRDFSRKSGYWSRAVWDHKFVTTEDLLLPSQEEKVKTFIELYNNNKDVHETVDKIKWQYSEPDLRGSLGEKWDKLDEDSQTRLDRNYRVFMNVFNQWNHPIAMRASEAFINALKSKGYNAIIDDNNANQYNEAHNPLYVFSGVDSLIELEKPEKVSNDEIYKNVMDVFYKTGEVWY